VTVHRGNNIAKKGKSPNINAYRNKTFATLGISAGFGGWRVHEGQASLVLQWGTQPKYPIAF